MSHQQLMIITTLFFKPADAGINYKGIILSKAESTSAFRKQALKMSIDL